MRQRSPSSLEPALNSRKYRAIQAQVRAEEPNCWLCGDPIDLTLDRQRDPWGSTIDHVVARSTPGFTKAMLTDRDGLRHAHRKCNAERQANPPTHQAGTSTRDW
jgi:5-methylcytosine-specific restriction endonuclease McrA